MKMLYLSLAFSALASGSAVAAKPCSGDYTYDDPEILVDHGSRFRLCSIVATAYRTDAQGIAAATALNDRYAAKLCRERGRSEALDTETEVSKPGRFSVQVVQDYRCEN